MESTVALAINELTCWKCGEDALVEAPHAAAGHGETAALHTHHSVCQKCGAFATNASQMSLNKIAGRKARKELIRQANRTSK